ncbi:ATP-binding protein [Pendulispora brunnea]|uniref:histidine kinase n=1 Tax=Pendulispora brunnea TaxID=2905690 RepID=A0ABZ2KEI7_9BACT
MLHISYFNRDIVAVRGQGSLPPEVVRVLELHWCGELFAAREMANKLLVRWEGAPPPLLVAEHALMTVKLGRSLPDVKPSALAGQWLARVVHEYARFLAMRLAPNEALVSLRRLFVLGLRTPASGLIGLVVFALGHLLTVRGWSRIGFPVARFFFHRTARRVGLRGKSRFSEDFVLATFLYTVLAGARLTMLESVSQRTQPLLPKDPFYQGLFLVSSLYTAAYSGDHARTEVVSAQYLALQETAQLRRYTPLAEILPLLPMALRGYGHLVADALSGVIARHEARKDDVDHAVHVPFFRTAALISLSAGRFGNAKIYITRAIRHLRLTKSFQSWNAIDQRILSMAEGHETFTPDSPNFFGIQLETTVPTSLGKLLCDLVSAIPASRSEGAQGFEERVFELLRRHLDCPHAEVRTTPAEFSQGIPQIRVGKRFFLAHGLGRKRAHTVDRIFAAVAPVLAILEHDILQMSIEPRADSDTQTITIHRSTQMLAHDVRRPFQLLRIGLESLGAVRTQGEALEVVRTLLPEVQRASQDVDHLIEDTMRMSRGPKPVPTPVDELVMGSLRDVFAARPDCEIELRYDGIEGDVHLSVDPVRMRRALSNVISNAVEAMQGAGVIWFALAPARDNEGFHELRIGNSGPPIAEEQLARIFDAFYSSGKPGGTGLGLAIAQRVVLAHAGHIGCANVPNGVEFRLTLPGAQARRRNVRAGSMPAHCHELSVTTGPTRRGPRQEIALVDDSRAIYLAWRATIGDDAKLRYFRSPAAFWETIEEETGFLERLFAVVTDFRFSNREDCGSKLAATLRQRRPDLPILVSSSGILEDVDVEGIFDGVIEKGGLSWPQLEQLVASVRATEWSTAVSTGRFPAERSKTTSG